MNYIKELRDGEMVSEIYLCKNSIVLTDDYLPYSFFFEGYMVQGTKTCGGVILHGEEDIQTAKYGIHT